MNRLGLLLKPKNINRNICIVKNTVKNTKFLSNMTNKLNQSMLNKKKFIVHHNGFDIFWLGVGYALAKNPEFVLMSFLTGVILFGAIGFSFYVYTKFYPEEIKADDKK